MYKSLKLLIPRGIESGAFGSAVSKLRSMTMINYIVVIIDLTAPKVRHYGKIEFQPTIGPRINSIFPL